MLWTALEDPDPVLIFEHQTLYNMEGELADDAGAVDIDRAAVRRAGQGCQLITYGGTLGKTLQAAETLAGEGIEAEVIDLRTLRPLDMTTILASVAKTHRAVIVDEGWRSGSLSAEIMRAHRGAGVLRPRRAGGARLQRRSADSLPQAPGRRGAAAAAGDRRRRARTSWVAVAEFRMPSLGADMEAGTLVEWLKQPGDAVQARRHHRGRRHPEGRDRDRGLRGRRARSSVQVEPGEKVPVGTVLAMIRGTGAEPPGRRAAASDARRAPAPAARAVPPSALARRPAAPASVAARTPAARSRATRRRARDGRRREDVARRRHPRRAAAARSGTGRSRLPRRAMRARIAAAMARSKREIPHYYLSTTIDMSAALAWLRAENETAAVTERLLPAVLLIKAVALALREVPELNGLWIDGGFRPGRRHPRRLRHLAARRRPGRARPARRRPDGSRRR